MAAFFKLIIEDDEGKTTVYPLAEEPVSIGRREDNVVRLMERNVSRCHARLTQQGEVVYIEDLDSYNGVRVNGERIQGNFEFREGDLVEIGDYHLALQRAVEEPAQRPAEVAAPPPAMAFADEAASIGLPLPPFPSQTELLSSAEVPPPTGEDTLLPGPSERSSVPRLICVSTEYAGQEFGLTHAEIVIGRVDDNDIVIEHRSVSRNHAKILFDGNNHKIIDLQSANGVLVNGEEYAMTDLRQGDHIELGHVHFRFVPADERYVPTLEEVAAMREVGVEPPPVDGLEPVQPSELDFASTEAPTEVYSADRRAAEPSGGQPPAAAVDLSRAETITQAGPPSPAAEVGQAVVEAPMTVTEARALPDPSASLMPEDDTFGAKKASPKIVVLVGGVVAVAAILLLSMLWLRKSDNLSRELTRLKAAQNYAGLVEYLDRQDPAADGVAAARVQAAALLAAQQRFEACSRRAPTPECKLDYARALQEAEEYKAAKAQLQQALREATEAPLQDEIKRRLKALSGG